MDNEQAQGAQDTEETGQAAAASASESTAAAATLAESKGPSSMLEAISAAIPEEPEAAREEGKNQEQGSDETAAAEQAKQGEEQGKDAAKPDAAEDLTQMPEGLTPRAQERFRKLVNENKERSAELEHMTAVIEPFRQSLQENGVTKEQFTLATSYIGLINKGDYQGALKIMDEERRQLALLAGMPLEGVDALSEYPDLRQAVDSFQINEQHAMELAKQRKSQAVTQQRQQQADQHRATQSQAREQFQRGQMEVDTFTRQMQKTDLDFARIEPILLQQIETGMLNDVPPHRWAAIVQAQYQAIKAATAASKQSAGPGFKSLRPTGADTPSAKPKSMHEAMWGNN